MDEFAEKVNEGEFDLVVGKDEVGHLRLSLVESLIALAAAGPHFRTQGRSAPTPY